jgi:hypothetical protein
MASILIMFAVLSVECAIQKDASALISGMIVTRIIQSCSNDLGVMLGDQNILSQDHSLFRKPSSFMSAAVFHVKEQAY